MQKAHDASKNDWWRNLPDITTPITQDELNRLETTVDAIDDRVVGFDLSKANQSDLLQSIKGITYNTETGVWVFTWWNGSTLTVDQNIEKIPVSFSMSPQGVITMTTSDGTQYTCDIAALIKTYSFLDSDTIDFTDTVDSDGNHTITADIKNGSITGEKLQPNYLADCVLAKQGAEDAESGAESAEETALTHQYTAEAWAKGTKNDVPVTPTDAQYHDNAYYWAQQARAIVGDKVDSFNGRTGTVVAEDGDYESGMIVPVSAQVGQIPVVRNVGTGQEVKLRYVNEDYQSGILPHVIVISEENSTVRLVKGGTTIYASETSREHFEADVPEFGTWTIHSVLNGEDAEVNLVVDSVKIYTVDDTHLHADITVTYPANTTCSCSKPSETTLYATESPYTFTVHALGAWTITVSGDGRSYSKIVNITEAGQTESITMPDINGSAITPTDDIITLLHCAGIFDSGIETVSDLLADDETLLKVINSTNAIDYLVRSTTFAGGSVPIMTSNTAPIGTCIQSGAESGNYAYSVFDGDDTTSFITTAAIANAYVGYTFPSAKKIVKCKALIGTNATAESHYTFKIQGSNDGSNWTDLADAFSVTLSGKGSTWVGIDLDGSNTYTSFRLIHPSTMEASRRMVVYTLQFYEADAVFNEDETAMSYIGANDYASNILLGGNNPSLVPLMTSNTAPSGECFSDGSPVYVAYKAFDGDLLTYWAFNDANAGHYLGYIFPEAKVVRAVGVFTGNSGTTTASAYVSSFKVQASNDGTTWTDLTDAISISPADGFKKFSFENNTAYERYRIYTLSSQSYTYLNTLQFYPEAYDSDVWIYAIGNSAYFEKVLNAKVPTMTSNTTPSGECFGTSNSTTYYNAFDGSTATSLVFGSLPCYVGYKFANPRVCLKRFVMYNRNSGGTRRFKTYKIQASNDGNTWEDISPVYTNTITAQDTKFADYILSNTGKYQYFRAYVTAGCDSSTPNEVNIGYIQFYGRRDGGVQSWLLGGGITDKNYTTLSEVLADSVTLSALMASEDAVDYLVSIPEWAETICADATAMTYIGLNNYAANTLLADSDWLSAICNSTYFESVLNVKVPTMTSNTTPSGVASASNANSGFEAYKAFDGDISSAWFSTSSANPTLTYKFASSKKIYYAKYVLLGTSSDSYTWVVKFRSSSDGSTFSDICDAFSLSMRGTSNTEGGVILNSSQVEYYQFYVDSSQTSAPMQASPKTFVIQFYGREDI